MQFSTSALKRRLILLLLATISGFLFLACGHWVDSVKGNASFLNCRTESDAALVKKIFSKEFSNVKVEQDQEKGTCEATFDVKDLRDIDWANYWLTSGPRVARRTSTYNTTYAFSGGSMTFNGAWDFYNSGKLILNHKEYETDESGHLEVNGISYNPHDIYIKATFVDKDGKKKSLCLPTGNGGILCYSNRCPLTESEAKTRAATGTCNP